MSDDFNPWNYSTQSDPPQVISSDIVSDDFNPWNHSTQSHPPQVISFKSDIGEWRAIPILYPQAYNKAVIDKYSDNKQNTQKQNKKNQQKPQQ